MLLTRAASGAVLVALAASLWGLYSLFLRPSGLPGMQCAVLVFAVMALPSVGLLRRVRTADRGARLALVIVGLADALNCGLYFAALQRGPIAIAVLTHYLAPILVTLLAPVLLGESRSRRALLAAPLSLAALALVIGRPDSSDVGLTALLGAGSAVGYAGVVLGCQRASRVFTPIEITSFHAAISLAVLLAVSGGSALPQGSLTQILPVIVGAALCGLVATILFNMGLKRVGSQVSGALTYLEPLSASIVGWWAWSEAMNPLQVTGGIALLALGAWVALERAAPALAVAPARLG